MARNRRDSRKGRCRLIAALLSGALAVFCIASSIQDKYDVDLGIPAIPAISLEGLAEAAMVLIGEAEAFSSAPAAQENEVSVHFIDVGQAEAILIRSGKASALIDAGENDQGDLVLAYLREQGVKKLDLVIGTHPHSDHIGGMDTVIRGMDVGTVVLPDIPDAVVPTTKTFTDLLLAVAEKGLKITPAKPGKEFDLGGATLTILAPTKPYDDLNNLSAASRLDYGEVSFLFTGDMEAKAERDLLGSGQELAVTVLNAAHHGSSTSTTKELLAAAAPEYAVISCGLDNSYGHPHRETMTALKDAGVKAYRTDLNGTVVFSTDGEEVHVDTQR